MLPYLLQIGPLKISTFGIFAVLAFITASFFLWKQLKEDYSEEDILSFTIDLFLASLIGARLLYIIENLNFFGLNILNWFLWGKYPGFSLLGAIIGGGLLFYYWTKKKRWDLWLTFDKTVIAFFTIQLIGGIGLFISSASMFDLARLITNFVLLGFSAYLTKNYRKFIWYKSGKLGFVAGSCFGLYFLLLGVLELFKRNGIYLDRIIFPILAIICFFIVYRRSERKWKEDLQNAKKRIISR
jgi:hypothetical protein